jgi:hypothetical protein
VLAFHNRRDFGLARELAERVFAMAQQAKAPRQRRRPLGPPNAAPRSYRGPRLFVTWLDCPKDSYPSRTRIRRGRGARTTGATVAAGTFTIQNNLKANLSHGHHFYVR